MHSLPKEVTNQFCINNVTQVYIWVQIISRIIYNNFNNQVLLLLLNGTLA